jgi:tight adherence protein C
VPLYVVIAAMAVVLSLPILWYSLAVDRVSGNRRVSQNLTVGLAEGGDLRALVLSQSARDRVVRPLLHALSQPAHRLSPGGVVESIQRRMELGGVTWPVEAVLVLKLALAAVGVVGGMVWASFSGSSVDFLAPVFAGFVGYIGPDVVLSRLATARQLTIANQLPDTLDQLSICVEAGLGFDAALARTARSGQGPLAEEIGRLLQELRVGVPRTEALSNVLGRTDVPELRQFVHALVQAEAYGVPVSRVLRAQASEQREKRRFRAEERAMKLPVKVIFPLVFCILPTLFIVVLGPAFVDLTKGLK